MYGDTTLFISGLDDSEMESPLVIRYRKLRDSATSVYFRLLFI